MPSSMSRSRRGSMRSLAMRSSCSIQKTSCSGCTMPKPWERSIIMPSTELASRARRDGFMLLPSRLRALRIAPAPQRLATSATSASRNCFRSGRGSSASFSARLTRSVILKRSRSSARSVRTSCSLHHSASVSPSQRARYLAKSTGVSVVGPGRWRSSVIFDVPVSFLVCLLSATDMRSWRMFSASVSSICCE